MGLFSVSFNSSNTAVETELYRSADYYMSKLEFIPLTTKMMVPKFTVLRWMSSQVKIQWGRAVRKLTNATNKSASVFEQFSETF